MKIKESKLRQLVKENITKLLNEGAGAGYDVSFEGLNVNSIQIGQLETNGSDKIIRFTASLSPGVVEWKAVGYYDGVTSDGIYYGDDLVDEIDEEQKTVHGGTINGWLYLDDVDNIRSTYETEPVTKRDVMQFIKYYLTDFSFKTMYGGGWSHVDLDNPIVLENIEIQDKYKVTYIYIDSIQIDAPEITNVINWYFENSYKLGEIYGQEEEEDDYGELEQQPIMERVNLEKIIKENIEKYLK